MITKYYKSLWLNNIYKVPIFIFCIIFLRSPDIVYSSIESSIDKRLIVVNSELDCVSKSIENKEEVTWDDVCYTELSQETFEAKRAALIQGTLDLVEKGLLKEQAKKEKYLRSTNQSNSNNKTQKSKEELVEKAKKSPTIAAGLKKFNTKKPVSKKIVKPYEVDVQLTTGYRRDTFDWNIAPAGGYPNILSELAWKDLQMSQIKTKTDVTIYDKFVVNAWVSHADIFKGMVQDSDYLGDDRTWEFLRSESRCDDGEALDWSFGTGMKFPLNFETEYFDVKDFELTILGGYSYHELNLIAENGVTLIDFFIEGNTLYIYETNDPIAPELHSSYWAEWKGPWVGFESYCWNLIG